MKQLDRSTLEMALIGYQAELKKIVAAIAAIRKQVDGHVAAPAVDGTRGPKRNMSAAARRRIAAAQRKRWAAFHAEKKGTAKRAPTRKLSFAAKAKLVANLAKARAAKAARVRRIAKAA